MEEPAIVEIYDLAGKLQKVVPLTEKRSEVSISDLAAGMYVLKHISKTASNSIRIIKL